MPLALRLETYLAKKKLTAVEKISRGFSAEIYLVQTQTGKKRALKIERDDSPRRDFIYKESEYLKMANHVQVGPKLIDADYENRVVLMTFVDGIPFGKWALEKTTTKTKLNRCIQSLLKQADQLDRIGLDHGQLAGKGKNILVTKTGQPVIIDFEKASPVRKPHNRGQIESFLFKNPHSFLVKTVKEKTGRE
ncbi:MAG: hypothetical protein J4215_03360 [Candidatus Diapherotrites archaeon]|uniref:non-specific serine/threonine protein kinase n=1 Tax=Candidatus Iainarchaeum sp. TaxID=3101447 RepID=A0A8T4L4Y9_9ARCH|nr:hypothetical protein [Candidatus Diapherotrites archaeon]